MIDFALKFYGLKEIPGEHHNPVILQFFNEIGHEWVKDDETAWCSAFANYVAKMCGLPYSGKLNARSWLDVGKAVDTPEVGDVVIFWRESPESWKGHVGFYISQDDSYIYCLGGNQNNQVNIKPYKKSRLLGYRKLF